MLAQNRPKSKRQCFNRAICYQKRVYDMKHKMDIWFFQEEKNMKNISTKNTKVSA